MDDPFFQSVVSLERQPTLLMSQQNLSGFYNTIDTSAELHAPHAVDDTPPIKNKQNFIPRGYGHP